MFYHKGLAEALGVTHQALEEMTLTEIAERAFDLGGDLTFEESGGDGPGLTFTAKDQANETA